MRPLANQRGIALLTVLGLLSVLLVLASLVAGSSRMEAALSGLGKESARAFAAAEAGLNYGLGDVNNFTAADSLDKGCCEGAGCAYDPRETDLVSAGLFASPQTSGYVRVCFDREGPPPPSIKVSALRFKAFHFDLDARGNANPNGSSFLQMEAARLGPSQ
ncbi:MAG: hypothetical protein IT293_00460 [Deltaproteobacteria bacterium]|nr:hypothetical protein [Deltaproteobacteria bacterium]